MQHPRFAEAGFLLRWLTSQQNPDSCRSPTRAPTLNKAQVSCSRRSIDHFHSHFVSRHRQCDDFLPCCRRLPDSGHALHPESGRLQGTSHESFLQDVPTLLKYCRGISFMGSSPAGFAQPAGPGSRRFRFLPYGPSAIPSASGCQMDAVLMDPFGTKKGRSDSSRVRSRIR